MFMTFFSDTQDCSNFYAIDKVTFQVTMAKKVECLLSDQLSRYHSHTVIIVLVVRLKLFIVRAMGSLEVKSHVSR